MIRNQDMNPPKGTYPKRFSENAPDIFIDKNGKIKWKERGREKEKKKKRPKFLRRGLVTKVPIVSQSAHPRRIIVKY